MRNFKTLVAIAALCAAAPAAYAGSNTNNLAVSASVTANCSITTTAVAFGAYDPVVANKTTAAAATGAVNIACTTGAAPTITLGTGLNITGTTRRLRIGTTGSNYMNYELYQPPNTTPGTACAAAPTQVWNTTGAGIFTPTASTSIAVRSYNVCGLIPAGQDVAIGAYADTVVATVNF